MPGLKVGTEIFRNHDQAFSKQLKRSADRRIRVDMRLSECDEGLRLALTDEQGISAAVTLPCDKQPADNPERALQQAEISLANSATPCLWRARLSWHSLSAIYCRILNGLRRDAIAALEAARLAAYRRPERRIPLRGAVYPTASSLLPRQRAEQRGGAVLRDHGVGRIAPAYEANKEEREVVLMTTTLHPLQPAALPQGGARSQGRALELKMGKESFRLRFDCHRCEMQVMGSLKRG
jgi:putative protease